MRKMKRNKISSLYIHIPFCLTLCHYCDFPKLQYFRNYAEQYLVMLKKELDSYKIDKDLKTIYIGGGTPTVIDDDLFYKLLRMVEPYSKHVIEYTIESNPESLSETKLKMMKDFGVTRISIGVESTNDNILKAINRPHTFNDVKTAVLRAKKYGVKEINLDLIIVLPNVSLGLLKADLANLLALKVPHLSLYSLTVHPNTVFGINRINPPSDDLSREYYDLVHDTLTKEGYVHYEISNFALKGHESNHNFVYWKDEEYYGIGLGASGYVNGIRYTNTKSIDEYLKGATIREKETVTLEDDKEYFIMLNLRTNLGIDLVLYREKFDE